MNWIEHLLRISPDGGSGAAELAIAVAVTAVISYVMVRRLRLRRHLLR